MASAGESPGGGPGGKADGLAHVAEVGGLASPPESCHRKQMYAMRPSVGSWLVFHPGSSWHPGLDGAACASGATAPLHLPGCASKMPPSASKAPCAGPKLPDFRKLPSVGSWLQLRLVEEASQAAPPASAWKAEFEAHFEDFSPAPGPGLSPMRRPRSLRADGGGAAVFKLAPPPSPAAVLAVGVSPAVGAEIVVIEGDTTKDLVPKPLASDTGGITHEELLGTNRAEDDIEFSLLGNDAVSTSVHARARVAHDGVDSPSDSEADTGSPHGQARTAIVQPAGRRGDGAAAASTELPSGAEALEAAPEGSQISKEAEAPAPVAAAPLAADTGQQPALEAAAAASPAKAPSPAAAAPPEAPPQAQAPRQTSPTSPKTPKAQQPQQQQAMAQPLSTSGLPDMDSLVVSALDRFFGDSRVWPQVEEEVNSSRKQQAVGKSGERRFRVQVPRPYPGVQYRRSKRLDDRYSRYAEHGTIVAGVVEDNGEWLRISGDQFLPMRVGAVEILEPLSQSHEGGSSQRAAPPAAGGFASWFSCCSASVSTDAELVLGDQRPTGSRGRQSERGEAGGAEATQLATADSVEPGPQRRAPLPDAICSNPLSNVDAANRHLTDPINPFADTDRAQSAERFDRRSANRSSSSSPNGLREGRRSSSISGRGADAATAACGEACEEYGAKDVFG